jgi:hypothetical protein
VEKHVERGRKFGTISGKTTGRVGFITN